LEYHKALPASGDRQQGVVDVCGNLYLYVLDNDPQRLGGFFDRFDHRPMHCIARVPDNRDTAEKRNHFLQKLEPLGSHLREKEGRPREVAAGASEIGNEASRHRIARDCHNDGYRGRRLFRRSGWRCAFGDDYIDLESDQVGSEGWEPVVVAVRISVLDGDTLALDIAQSAQG